MALQSMTGFARESGVVEDVSWVWEVRSVNGKGLDFRLKTPPGYDHLQPEIRKIINNSFSRGNLQINLQIESSNSQQIPTINHAVLDAVLDAATALQERLKSPPPSAEHILAIKGVLEITEKVVCEEEILVRDQALLAGMTLLMMALEKSRKSEGAAIGVFLTAQIDQIEALTQKIDTDPSRSLEQIKSRLAQQVALLIENASSLDQMRLHQEAAILAAKADLQEELDRLVTHISAARELIANGSPVGRKLEFLIQEFNRECNTICSKSNAASVTTSGLDMKIIIDQLREQVQNVE